MGVSAFDLELSPEGDLLHIRGGMEQFLNVFETSHRGLVSAAHPVPPNIASLQLMVRPLKPLEPPPTPLIPPPAFTAETVDAADTALLTPLTPLSRRCPHPMYHRAKFP